MNNEIKNVLALFAWEFGRASQMTRQRSHDASGSILYLYKPMNARRCKISFLCNTLWVGKNRKIEKNKAAAKSCHSHGTWVSKVPRQEPSIRR